MSRIEIRINRVVLRGFDAAGRTAFVDGLKTELARALENPAHRAEWSRSQRWPVLKLGRVSMERSASGARKLGAGVARAIRKGMTQ
jgi:hypothetical protein